MFVWVCYPAVGTSLNPQDVPHLSVWQTHTVLHATQRYCRFMEPSSASVGLVP